MNDWLFAIRNAAIIGVGVGILVVPSLRLRYYRWQSTRLDRKLERLKRELADMEQP